MAASPKPSYKFDIGYNSQVVFPYPNGKTTSITLSSYPRAAYSMPDGFAVINHADSNGQMSSTTTATFTAGPRFEYALPQSWFSSRPYASDFTVVSGSWTPSSVRTEYINNKAHYVVTLDFTGATSSTTVARQSYRPSYDWPGSTYEVTVDGSVLGADQHNHNPYAYVRMTVGFKTNNGYVLPQSTTGWVQVDAS